MLSIRELSHRSNGDCWYLAHDSDTERVFVKHEANLPSGGHIAGIEIGAFRAARIMSKSDLSGSALTGAIADALGGLPLRQVREGSGSAVLL